MAISVKFLAKTPPDQDPALWLSLFPSRHPQIGDVSFNFDMDSQDYDWLVVYEGLPSLPGEKKINRREKLACARENTMLITTEPSSIRIDGPHFLRQFGHVLTAKNPQLVKHPNQIFQTPPLRWFYGRPMSEDDTHYVNVDDFNTQAPIPKNYDLSTVCSNKRMAHTVHAQRYDCIMELKRRLGDELHLFGRGINPISNKAEAMDDFRYHIAIENHIEPHHWTEKIADCFLAYCLPFYYGPPNISEYFPQDSVIPIDIFDIDGAENIIRASIAAGLYEKRLPAIIEARNRVLNDYNLMNVIARLVTERHQAKAAPKNAYIDGRHIYRKHHPFKSSLDGIHRIRFKNA